MSPARQRGNTLTGIIIGLVIGLVIAVIVALLITKGATPFTDKSGKLGKMGEPSIGQASDPNKPLYGNKEAAREANKQFANRAAPAAPAPAAEPDPLGEAIAGMAPEQADAPAAAPVFMALILIDDTRAKLALLGFEAAITDRTNDSGVLHRVRVGPYNQVEAMNKARAKLLDAGVDVAIVRNQNK
jgi:cell division protein FtsN